jgi:hypothetical protein
LRTGFRTSPLLELEDPLGLPQPGREEQFFSEGRRPHADIHELRAQGYLRKVGSETGNVFYTVTPAAHAERDVRASASAYIGTNAPTRSFCRSRGKNPANRCEALIADDGSRTRDLRIGKPRRRKRRITTEDDERRF